MINLKKGQIISESFKYVLVGFMSIVILIFGYKTFNIISEKACRTDIAKFEIDLHNIDQSVRFGAKELQSYNAPCNVDRVYFFDLTKSINPEDFKDVPLIKDSLKSGSDKNVFLVKEGSVKDSFNAGNLDIEDGHYICFLSTFGKISFFVENIGVSARITVPSNQPVCT